MKKIIIVAKKKWNIIYAKEFKRKNNDKYNIEIIYEKSDFNYEYVNSFEPDYIFLPHWSYKIPEEIHKKYETIVFHMTDLPFGRGGSPLQNLIKLGFENTKISALRATNNFDEGDIFLKTDLNLNGNAEEIFFRFSEKVFNEMIPMIIENNYNIEKQSGEITTFKRLNIEDNLINFSVDLKSVFNQIRMVDAESYPNAYININDYCISFSRATFKGDYIISDAIIRRING
jgi:methionyl-tRNA formyltransferase